MREFVDELMDHIMEGMMIPKVQIERAVGPILGFFLAEVVTEAFKDDPEMSGEWIVVCPEFPFKKKESLQSENVDWLLLNTSRNQLCFLELKTSDTSVDKGQNALYKDKQASVGESGAGFLLDDLKLMRNASGEFGKYDFVIDTKVQPLRDQISRCREAKILYLVPESAVSKVSRYTDRVLSFTSLPESIPGDRAREWSIIRGHLCRLDESSKRSRNKAAGVASDTGDRRGALNYEWSDDFETTVARCRSRGDEIVVGYMGGARQLGKLTPSQLQSTKFKSDLAVGGTGHKVPKNWMSGTDFLRAVELVRERSHGATDGGLEVGPGGDAAKGAHDRDGSERAAPRWQGTLRFPQMVELCREHGGKVVIGFTGGRDAFLAKSLEELRGRLPYKWDYSTNMQAKKKADWLSGRDVLRMLVEHHGLEV